jgi:hypothetical protein
MFMKNLSISCFAFLGLFLLYLNLHSHFVICLGGLFAVSLTDGELDFFFFSGTRV